MFPRYFSRTSDSWTGTSSRCEGSSLAEPSAAHCNTHTERDIEIQTPEKARNVLKFVDDIEVELESQYANPIMTGTHPKSELVANETRSSADVTYKSHGKMMVTEPVYIEHHCSRVSMLTKTIMFSESFHIPHNE